MNKEEFLLSIPDSISLAEALSDVAVIFVSASFIYRKKSQGDLEKYICFHKELKWGVYKHEDKYFLVNIGHPYKVLGIESKATLQKVTEVLTDANDDSYLEKASIKGSNVLRKTSDSEKLFLQTITEYDSKQEAFKAEELVKQIKEKTKAAPKRAAAESDRTEVSDEASVSEDEESVSEKSSDEVEVPEEIAATDEPISKEDALSEAEPDKTEVSDEASVSAVPANAADTDLASLDLKKNNNTKKNITILVGILVLWAPLAYVLYGSDTGEPLLLEIVRSNAPGWIVPISVIVFCTYAVTFRVISGGKKSLTLASKTTYLIFYMALTTATIAVRYGIGQQYLSLDFNLFGWNGLEVEWIFVPLAYLYVRTWQKSSNHRKNLAQAIETASLIGISIETLRDELSSLRINKHQKASTNNYWKQLKHWNLLLKNSEEYQEAIEVKDAQRRQKKVWGAYHRVKGAECRKNGRPFCVWCGFSEFSMETVRGKSGAPIWEYRNQDGSRDKRVKDNFTQAAWSGEYKCNECGATTLTKHYLDRNPDESDEVWNYALKEGSKGSGKRTASDHDSSKEGESVNRNEAHRKGDD